MSHGGDIDRAASHVEPTLGWGSLQQGMPFDELMRLETEDDHVCVECGFDPREEESKARVATMGKLMAYFFSDGRPEAWELVAQRVYALAKAYYPHLLVVTGPEGQKMQMSLAMLAIVFDEPNTDAARARWSARIKRMVTDLVTKGGGHAKAAFQKSTEACAKLSQKLQGNQNRKKKGTHEDS